MSRPAASAGSNKGSPQLSKALSKHPGAITSELPRDISIDRDDLEDDYIHVVARVSTHALRLEREYHLCKSLIQNADPEAAHTIRPLELAKLSSQQGDDGPVVVFIFESPGRDSLEDIIDFYPGLSEKSYSKVQTEVGAFDKPTGPISLPTFLDFAIGACQCLELLHHGMQAVHGEIRLDAFHFDSDRGVVKLVNFGAGPKSFENNLTSAGWLTLSREIGIKNKLQFIASLSLCPLSFAT